MSISVARYIRRPSDGWRAVLRHWTAFRQRKAAYDALERLLARDDDRLFDDVGIDRETAHRLVGQTMVVPHRVWDRWQG